MIILYINYVDSDRLNSGSSLRPYKMLQAFLASGHEIITLMGNQMSRVRKQKVREISCRIDSEKPDLCYIESPTRPIYRHCDRALIRKIHRMEVPIGYFYRDFFQMFRDEFPRRRNSIANYLKDLIVDILLPFTNRCLKNNCNIIYFPSDECKELFRFEDMRGLPPAGEKRLMTARNYSHTCIYVGGVGGYYDINTLLNVFNVLYGYDASYKLILVCRKTEWDNFQNPLKKAPWLEVHHLSGSDLIPLYRQASVGLVVPNLHYRYNRYAISVKAYEYMSYGLPIVTFNHTAIGEMVIKDQVGIAADHSIASFIESIKTILSNKDMYFQYVDKVEKSLLEKNLWKHRVAQIIEELSMCSS